MKAHQTAGWRVDWMEHTLADLRAGRLAVLLVDHWVVEKESQWVDLRAASRVEPMVAPMECSWAARKAIH